MDGAALAEDGRPAVVNVELLRRDDLLLPAAVPDALLARADAARDRRAAEARAARRASLLVSIVLSNDGRGNVQR